jgi:arylsulfatase A-like enzyme
MSMGTRAGRTVAACCSVAALALAGLWWTDAAGGRAPAGVVVVTLDTTRADRLSPYGFMDVSLPALERLAREGVVFDQATSVAPLTLPAHTSLFTGRLPMNHGVRDNADAPLAPTATTLAEILAAQGFRTGAFVGSLILNPDRGLDQGFQRYSGVPHSEATSETGQRRADAVIDDAIAWLDTIGASPFFLWAHLYDAHRPYDPPEPYGSRFGHDLYEGEIAFADSQIGRLVQALEERHLLDRVVVVVTADHGESLGAHGERDHGIFVYQDTLHVPLIVRAPGLKPIRVGDVVRLTDVMPTVLDLVGVPSPPTDGASLVALMRGERQDLDPLDLEAYSESLYPERLGWSPLRALRRGRFKLIDAPRPELYDLERDPFETRNIYAERPALARAMTARLAAFGSAGGTSQTRWTDADPDLPARLAALGYVGTALLHEPSAADSLPDPKDCLGSDGTPHPAFLRPAGDQCLPNSPPIDRVTATALPCRSVK